MPAFPEVAVLHHHRHFGEYERLVAEKRWQQLPQADTRKRRVGILGLGILGAQALMAAAFEMKADDTGAVSV